MSEQLTPAQLLQEIINNAPVDRAGAWLELAAQDYPEISAALLNNLHEPPSTVIAALCAYNPAGYMLAFVPHAHDWIARLQAWFIERGY